MGGEKEVVIPSGKEGKVGKLRVHTNSGQVHFHDDQNNTKTSVPISLWWKIWNDLSTCQRHTWEYVDPVNKSLLLVVMTAHNDNYEVEISIKSVNIGPTFEMLRVHGL